MNKTLFVMLSLAISTVTMNSAVADTKDRGVNKHQRHQHERIEQGVKSGELTRDEAKELRGDRKELRQKERTYMTDGKLTKEERMDLRKDSKENSKEIYNEKHDEDKRLRAE
jgi:CRISPR/Cas system-associated endoribonuclease Cas2